MNATVNDIPLNRRGKKPSGIFKDNVCVRLTIPSQAYLADLGAGSKSKGVDSLIAWHKDFLAKQAPAGEAEVAVTSPVAELATA